VRPAPQAATDAARVMAPAAAMNRRNVVLRMEPLSADRSDRLGVEGGAATYSRRARRVDRRSRFPGPYRPG
jgi:hypothetical protein